MDSEPKIAVGFASWNARDDLAQALDHVRRAELPAQRFVVDNGSTDGTAEMVRARAPDCRLRVNATNRGAAGGRNDLFEDILASDAEFVLLLDPDVFVRPDALRWLVTEMGEHPEVDVLGMKAYYADRPDVFWCRGGARFNPWRARFERTGQRERDVGQYDRVAPVDTIPACLTFLRRRALACVPRMDEAYFIYHEESDWNFAMRRQGLRLATSARARAMHRVSSSLGLESPLFYYYRTRNMIRFIRRNVPWPQRLATLGVYLAGPLANTALTLRLSRRPVQLRAVRRGVADAFRGRWGRCPHADLYPGDRPT